MIADSRFAVAGARHRAQNAMFRKSLSVPPNIFEAQPSKIFVFFFFFSIIDLGTFLKRGLSYFKKKYLLSVFKMFFFLRGEPS